MVRNEVEDHADVATGRLGDELVGIGEGAQRRVDADVVGDVVTPVGIRRDHDRIEPDRVDTEILEMIEPRGNPSEVPHAVVVRVHVRTRVDLIQHAIAPPRAPGPVLGHLGHAPKLSALPER